MLLPLELRFMLNACARAQLPSKTTTSAFSTYAPLLRRKAPSRPQIYLSKLDKDGEAVTAHGKLPETTLQTPRPEAQLPISSSTELVRRPGGYTFVDEQRRKVDVPMKVLPKAQITPGLTLSPKERLQLEFLTRTPPKKLQTQQGFKERLLIYHGGLALSRQIVFSRVMSYVWFFSCLLIGAPAYYIHGSPLIDVAGILLFGTAPLVLFYFVSKPFVTWIYLPLPDFARKSPMAALKYAQNLPETATLNINFMRATCLPGNVDVRMADLEPLNPTWFSKSFEWAGRRVDKGSWYRPNPTKFWVREKSGKGKEARDVVPGIWDHVYGKIMRIEKDTANKWRK